MGKNIKIVVTGENRDLEENIPSAHLDSDVSFQWVQWPVLEFKKLTVSPEVLARVIEKPYEWIIFTSPRAVRFWTETMVEAGLDFPLETPQQIFHPHVHRFQWNWCVLNRPSR